MKKIAIKSAGAMMSKAKFFVNKNAPHIWLVAGIGFIIGGTVWACHASRKLDDRFDAHTDAMDEIEQEYDVEFNSIGEHTDEDGNLVKLSDEEFAKLSLAAENTYKKNVAKQTIMTGITIARDYAPAVIMIACGIGMVVNGHHILSKRNAALLTAYKTLDDTFTKYRSRVVNKYGSEVDEELYTGRTYIEQTKTEVGEDGKKTKVKEKVPVVGETLSPYARFFDESSTQWQKSPDYNHTFLVCQQNAANDMLRARGHLFLNEVYKMLGLPESPTGAICGWILPEDADPLAEGDNYVDFGFQLNHAFVNGTEKSVLLDFNCQGMIYDLI